ncbi:MAG: 3-phosphoserine/phosphohydroxythreonine transaminase [Phycisphaerales bacterium JB037]
MTSTSTTVSSAAGGTSGRTYNFSAGPGALPESVLRQAQEDIWDLFGTGIGILEHSHRGKAYDRVLEEAIADCRKVGSIPDDYEVMFVQGGATTQCFQVPMYFLAEDRTADYFETGKWAQDSIHEAKRYGHVHVCGSSAASNFDHIPTGDEVSHSDNPVYVHFTSNNTIMGTEFQTEPEAPGDAFLVCDASSDIFSRPIDVTKYGFIYAGGQKNLGPAGTVLVIARKDVLKRNVREMPWMLDYALLAKKESRYNTPPTFGVYLMGQVFKWILSQGGVNAIEKANRDKAKIIYDVIDASGFYEGHATLESRSMMNITFRLPSEELTEKFIAEAGEHGMDGLPGHRSVGGIRASIYNAFPRAGCEAFAQFMRDFEQRNG